MKSAALLLLLLAGGLAAQQLPFTVSPTSLAFGNVPIGAGGFRTFTVTTAPTLGAPSTFNFTVTVVEGARIFSTSDPAFTLRSGESKEVTVSFSPFSLGPAAGSIRVEGRVGAQVAGAATVSLNGTGIAAFTVTPISLTLGNVLVGCRASQTFQVNPNTALSFSVESNNGAFTVTPPTFFAQSPLTVTVTFTPGAPGPVSGLIIVSASQEGKFLQSVTVPVSGTGFEIVPAPGSIDFGSVEVGTSSTPRTVRLTTNPVVQAALQYSAATNNAAFRSSAVSASGEAQITFAPAAPGASSAIITYTITQQQPAFQPCAVMVKVTVSGVGTALNITMNPTSLDFGRVDIGTTSGPRNVNLVNSTALTFTGTATSSNPAFIPEPTSFTVGPGGVQTLRISFRPAATGPLAGTITFALSSGGGGDTVPILANLTLSLSGQGQTPPALAVSPESIDFGDVTVGSFAIRTVTVTNTGQGSGPVTGSTNNAGFVATPASFTLAGGASQIVNITFTPGAAGAVQATATFAIAGSTRTVALSGRGLAPTFSFAFVAGGVITPLSPPGPVPLPRTPVGGSNSVAFQIGNTGTSAATINSISLSGAVFAVEGLSALPAQLPPGASLNFVIAFRPTAPGNSTGRLNIDGRAFDLTGIGLVGGVTITGAGATVAPATQPAIGVQFADRYPAAVSGQLILTFTPNAVGGDDPAIQFAGGGRTVNFTIPANGNAANFTFQSGTVAGTITFRVALQVGETDVTPSPAPSRSITVARAAPSIRSVSIANRTATGFQVVIVGFATTREMGQVVFRFSPAGAGNLQTMTLTVDVGTLFANWYRSTEAAPHGSLFTLTVPFTVQGDISAIRSVSATLNNGDGNSPALEANF